MTTLLAHNERKAAHDKHPCNYCHKRIGRGELYLDQRLSGEGTAWTWRAHLDCHSAYWSWAPEQDEQYELSDLSDGHMPPCPLAWDRRGPYAPPCECGRQQHLDDYHAEGQP